MCARAGEYGRRRLDFSASKTLSGKTQSIIFLIIAQGFVVVVQS